MKKFLMIAALVAVVTAPAFAGLAPGKFELATNAVSQQITLGSAGRSGVYSANDPRHVYDNMGGVTAALNAPADILYQFTVNPASGAVFNQLQLKPGATNISSMHVVVDTNPALPDGAPVPMQFCFYQASVTSAGGHHIGNFLTTTASGSTACYNVVFPGNSLALFTIPLSVKVNAVHDLWVGFQGTASYRLRGSIDRWGPQVAGHNVGCVTTPGVAGSYVPNQRNGNNGNNCANGSLYIGSGDGVLAGGTTAPGFNIPNLSGAPSNFGYTTGFVAGGAITRYLGNFHIALGGAPEPTTAVLLGLGGLLMLRRRKIKA